MTLPNYLEAATHRRLRLRATLTWLKGRLAWRAWICPVAAGVIGSEVLHLRVLSWPWLALMAVFFLGAIDERIDP